MLDFSNLVSSRQRFEVTLKPTGMSRRKNGVKRPEFVVILPATDRHAAATAARRTAEESGFDGYAVTSIKEIKHERT